jgi:hypothetical protein
MENIDTTKKINFFIDKKQSFLSNNKLLKKENAMHFLFFSIFCTKIQRSNQHKPVSVQLKTNCDITDKLQQPQCQCIK